MVFHPVTKKEYVKVLNLLKTTFAGKIKSVTPLKGVLKVKSIQSNTLKHLKSQMVILK